MNLQGGEERPVAECAGFDDEQGKKTKRTAGLNAHKEAAKGKHQVKHEVVWKKADHVIMVFNLPIH